MPTLEPSREGLTQSGAPICLAALAPAGLAGGDEVDLGDAGLGEEPLQRQLVHADSRGEDVGADVGKVEPLEQALDAAVLTEGAVQGREDGVGAEQAAAGGELDRLALAAPARPSARSSPPAPRARPPPGRGQRPRRSAARRRARRSGRRRGPRPSFFCSGFRFARRGRPCRRRASPCCPASTSEPGGGNWSVTRPTCEGTSVSCSCTVGFSPAARSASTASARSLPITLGIVAFSSPLETTIETVEPGGSCEPALGDWRITCPSGCVLSIFFDAGHEAAAADLLHRERALRADQHRHLGQLRAAGDLQHDLRAPWSRSARRMVRS